MTRSGHWADSWWRKWYWHYQANMWLAVSNVASVTEIFSHGHIPWSHHMSFSVWLCAPHHFAKKPKNTLLPAAISFYLGTDKDVNISNTDSTFLSLCVMLYSGPCSVSLQSRVTVVFSSPLLAICNICSLLHCMLCLLWDQQSCLHCKCWHSSLHLSVCVKCGTEASFNSQSHQELIELFVSECSRHDIRNGTTHEHSQRKLMYTMTEGSVISESVIRTSSAEKGAL